MLDFLPVDLRPIHPCEELVCHHFDVVRNCVSHIVDPLPFELDAICAHDKLFPPLRLGHVGGGRLDIPYRVVVGVDLTMGDLAGLYDGDVLQLDRLHCPGEAMVLQSHELIVSVALHAFIPYMTRVHMMLVSQRHSVKMLASTTVVRRRTMLLDHTCDSSCARDLWILRRPVISVVNPFNRVNYLPSASDIPSLQSDSVFTAGLGIDVQHSIDVDVVPTSTSAPLSLPSAPEPFPPKPLSRNMTMEMIRRWAESTSSFVLSEDPCAVCGELKCLDNLRKVKLSEKCFDILYSLTNSVTNEGMHLPINSVLCAAAVNLAAGTANVCKTCDDCLRKRKVLPRLALANGLWLGDVPDALADLNYVEKLCVARYRHNTCVATVSTGARKMHANAIVFSQPTAKFCAVLPPSRDELSEVLGLYFTGPCAPTEADFQRTPFLIRKTFVLHALTWLRENHKDYADLAISQENLDSYPSSQPPVAWYHLPSDGTIPAEAQSVHDAADAEVGTDEGPCSFAIHGIVADDIVGLSRDARVALALKHLKDGGSVIGYGHSGTPESIYHNPRLYPGMFPWLYPYGLGGFGNELISIPVPTKTHIRHLMFYHDRRFQVDEFFPFIAFNQEQIKASSRGGFVLTERRNFEDVVDKILNIDLEVLSTLVQRGKANGFVQPETDAERKCYELISIVDHVAGHVPASNTRKKYQRSEIRSLIIRYGVPVFFITFAPSESKNPICLYLCGEDIDLDNYLPMSSSDRDRLRTVVCNPAACARFFDLMVNLFIKHVLKADSNESGLFGKTSAYYGTVEQQGRLTLHLHLLLWISGSCSPPEIRDNALAADHTFATAIIAWLESCHQGQFSTGSRRDVENRLNKLGRPAKYSKPKPWWADPTNSLPSPPPPSTAAQDVQDAWFQKMLESSDDIVCLANTHDSSHSKGCLRPPDFECRARFPRNPLYSESFVDQDSGALRFRKDEAWINTYNVVLSYLMRCNTDVTCLLSGTQVRAVLAYVTDYITKMSLKTYTIFETIQTVISGNATLVSDSPTRADAARKLIVKVVNALTSQLQTGGPLVCGQLMDLPDHYKNKHFKVFYWYSYTYAVANAWDEDTSADTSSAQSTGSSVLLKRHRGSEIVAHTKVHDYSYRPDELCHMTLYDYLENTDVKKSRPRAAKALAVDGVGDCLMDIDGGVDRTEEGAADTQAADAFVSSFRLQAAHPNADTHVVRLLKTEHSFILNFAGSVLPRKDCGDREAYCRAMMTFFSPGGWRVGTDLRSSSETWDAAFERTNFSAFHLSLMKNMNVLYECQDARDDFSALRRAEGKRKYLAMFLQDDTVDELDKEKHALDVVDAVTDETMNTSSIAIGNLHGAKSLKRRAQMEEMSLLIAAMDAQASTMNYNYIANVPQHVSMPSKEPHQWKEIVTNARRVVSDARRQRPVDSPSDPDGCPVSIPLANQVRLLTAPDLVNKMQLIREITSQVQVVEHINKVSKSFDLNADQRRAFDIAALHIVDSKAVPLRMYLGGMGGTGKTRVIRALSTFFEERKEGYRFALTAPTGSAASIIGGTTYHSLLGIPKNGLGVGSLAKVKDRLALVDLLFLDEVSMLSCQDIYTISSRLSNAFDRPLESFGGKHIILAGDFAQLPPPGALQLSLYNNNVGMKAGGTNINKQKSALGRGLWHTFNTVVILKENMRQVGLSTEDSQFRTALENIRFKSCTPTDLAVLRSRLCGTNPGQPHIGQPRFRNLSIITGLNSHRDAINHVACVRFARQHNVKLQLFHSRDKLAASANIDNLRKYLRDVESGTRLLTRGVMPTDLQEVLWSLSPSSTSHVPSVLALCIGMPILLKHNEATELCATNGAEAHVISWDSEATPSGKLRLKTVFAQLHHPPRDTQIEGLPLNVIPIPCTTSNIECTLPDDTTVTIHRMQVFLLPNFAMTDYGSQGRTRPVNPVDLRFCKGHQSIYTCLSRSSTLAGTLILAPFQERKLVGGAAPDLQRELRELEILNDITLRKYERTLPSDIDGEFRSGWITTYQKRFGAQYVPLGVHRSLDWSRRTNADLLPPIEPDPWKVLRPQTAVRGQKRKLPPRDAPPKEVQSKRPRRLPQNTKTQLEPLTYPPLAPAPDPIGLRWDNVNWSCAYDSLLTVLWNARSRIETPWLFVVSNNPIAALIESGFRQIKEGSRSFETVREQVRDAISAVRGNTCARFGPQLTAIDLVIDSCMQPSEPYAQHVWSCLKCDAITKSWPLHSYIWSTAFNST